MNPQQMGMAGMPNAGGPVGGTPLVNSGSNGGVPGGAGGGASDLQYRQARLNTYIYDYFLRTKHYDIARLMHKASKLSGDKTLPLVLDDGSNPMPGSRDVNGVSDAMDTDTKDVKPKDLPDPGHKIWESNNCFLDDWWAQFWDVFDAQRGRSAGGVISQFISANHVLFPLTFCSLERGSIPAKQPGQHAAARRRPANDGHV
jgi:hypothetical protein